MYYTGMLIIQKIRVKMTIDKNRAIFLDRDGTLIYDEDYLADPAKVTLMPGAVEAISKFKNAGYMLIIITNQSGIGRGIFSEEDMNQVNDKVSELFRDGGIEFDAVLFCPHTPEDNCECRKPSPKLLIDAAEQFNIDLSNSVMIGDKKSDAECGIAAGCKYNIFLDNGKQPPPDNKNIIIADNLIDAFASFQ